MNSKKLSNQVQSNSANNININIKRHDILRDPVEVSRGTQSQNNIFRPAQNNTLPGNDKSIERDLDTSVSSNASNSALKSSIEDYNSRIYDYIYSQGILSSTPSNKSSPDRNHLHKSPNLDTSVLIAEQSRKNAVDSSMVDAYDDWMNRLTSTRTSPRTRKTDASSASVICSPPRVLIDDSVMDSAARGVRGQLSSSSYVTQAQAHLRDVSQALSSINGNNDDDDDDCDYDNSGNDSNDNDDDDDGDDIRNGNIGSVVIPFDEDETDEDFNYSRVVPIPMPFLPPSRHPDSVDNI